MSVDDIRVDPWKISDKPGFDTTAMEIDLGAQTHRAVRIGHGERAEPLIKRYGVVCGLDRVGPNSRPLKVDGPATLALDISYGDLGVPPPPDGDYQVNVHDRTDGGWE